jgi:hypothetical protein
MKTAENSQPVAPATVSPGTLSRVASEEEHTEVQLEFDWSAAVGVEAQVVNQFLLQIGMPAGDKPDGVHLLVGHSNPPVVVGNDETSRREQVARYGGKLPVTVHGRYFFSRARLEELRQALDKLAGAYDELSEPGSSSA